MNAQMKRPLNPGSLWCRWDPHIHAPGTVLNNQFTGPKQWERYLQSLRDAVPTIQAIGVTDYYSTEAYERVRHEHVAGQLPDCRLVFPNVEMRLAVGTIKGQWINIHLLVSPEDEHHLEELQRFLGRLTFRAYGDTFSCVRDDIVRLGQQVQPTCQDESALLRVGTEQFKVTFDQLRQVYTESTWAQNNILVAVAGNTTDGTSGLRDGADATLRQEVERFAHVIFAGSSAQREFWLGRRAATVAELTDRYGGLKPCLHGSDAHEQGRVGAPDHDRYSWIKGNPCFDALRQACIDPADRAFVGTTPPGNAGPSQVIDTLAFKDAPWVETPLLRFNPGLVTIIGERGSGKTALADAIALACDATPERLTQASFLVRAKELLGDASAELRWRTGEANERRLDGDEGADERYPRARYLSQAFVEELCSAQGMTDTLMQEIERVVFEAHSLSDRNGAIDFKDLFDTKVLRHREARTRGEEGLAEISDSIGIEAEKHRRVTVLEGAIQEKDKAIASYKKHRSSLPLRGSEGRVKQLAALTEAAGKVRGYVRYFVERERAILSLREEVADFRKHKAPEVLRRTRERHSATGIGEAEWESFRLRYSGDVDQLLVGILTKAQQNTEKWKGVPPGGTGTESDQSYLADTVKLDQQPLALLEAETRRIEKLVSVDHDTKRKFVALSKRIEEEAAVRDKLAAQLADCRDAKKRITALVQERESAYLGVFESLLREQSVLAELYGPLMGRLDAATGTLGRLSFSVRREANVVLWAEEGERLLDLRYRGPFRGRGTLYQVAERTLRSVWEVGDPQSVVEAMRKFRADNIDELVIGAPARKGSERDDRAWPRRFAKWLYGTDHIEISYSIDYDGVDIRNLSPGTRGIVLLLLYLALDAADDRPLIIDQPEESLDPKSIFDDLVGLFLDAKKRRQVIMVTHNANLVVNTDADQVIVAHAGPQSLGKLPPIRYLAGGLEVTEVRKEVCDILEGGERAFRERARRLRLGLAR